MPRVCTCYSFSAANITCHRGQRWRFEVLFSSGMRRWLYLVSWGLYGLGPSSFMSSQNMASTILYAYLGNLQRNFSGTFNERFQNLLTKLCWQHFVDKTLWANLCGQNFLDKSFLTNLFKTCFFFFQFYWKGSCGWLLDIYVCHVQSSRTWGHHFHRFAQTTAHLFTLVSPHNSIAVQLVLLFRVHCSCQVVRHNELFGSFRHVHLLCV